MDIYQWLKDITEDLEKLLKTNWTGLYLHGSLALGGFQEGKSDVDLIAVTKRPLTLSEFERLTEYILRTSGQPYPLEVTFLNEGHLHNWQHPSTFDLHFSEMWRSSFEKEELSVVRQKQLYINDPDLSAHLGVIHEQGVVLAGKSIKQVFPVISREDFLSSLLYDSFSEIDNMEGHPDYHGLNLLRLYCYLTEGVICSKLEGGEWGLANFPCEYHHTISQLIRIYKGEGPDGELDLRSFQSYMKEQFSYFKELKQ